MQERDDESEKIVAESDCRSMLPAFMGGTGYFPFRNSRENSWDHAGTDACYCGYL